MRTRSQRSSKRWASSARRSSSPSPVTAETSGAPGKRFASRRRPERVDAVDLVQDHVVGDLGRADLAEDLLDRRTLTVLLVVVRRRVDHVENQIRDECLLERRREALDELCR